MSGRGKCAISSREKQHLKEEEERRRQEEEDRHYEEMLLGLGKQTIHDEEVVRLYGHIDPLDNVVIPDTNNRWVLGRQSNELFEELMNLDFNLDSDGSAVLPYMS